MITYSPFWENVVFGAQKMHRQITANFFFKKNNIFLRIFCFLAARQTCEADRYKILGRKDKNAFSVRTKLAMLLLLLLLLSLSPLLLLCCCMPSLVTKTSTNTKKLVSSNSSSSLMMIFYRILLFRPFYIRPVSLPN